MHLTTQTLQRLLDGTATPAEARAMAAHLDEECAACEALLATADAAPLDALADRALTSFGSPGERGNDIEYARIQRALHAKPARAPVTARSRLRRLVAPLAAAAAVAVVGGIGVQLAAHHGRDDAWDGVKGVAPAVQRVPVRISAVALVADAGSSPRIARVANGDDVPREASLQLRLEIGRAADVAVARVGPDGGVEVFWHERVAQPGAVPLMVAGHPAAYPLSALSGPQRFIVLAAPDGLGPERLAAASRTLGARRALGAEDATVDGISIDELSVTVR